MYCPNCGAQIADTATICGYCGQPTGQQTPVNQQPAAPQYTQPQPQTPEKKENMVMGIVGALIGALLGGASIILFLQANIVASLSGLILAFCTLKGYQLLGGKLSTLGIVICVVLMLIVPYFANEVDCALKIADEFNMEFADAYEAIGEAEDLGILQGRTETLGTVYAFTILGGAAYVASMFQQNKKKK